MEEPCWAGMSVYLKYRRKEAGGHQGGRSYRVSAGEGSCCSQSLGMEELSCGQSGL